MAAPEMRRGLGSSARWPGTSLRRSVRAAEANCGSYGRALTVGAFRARPSVLHVRGMNDAVQEVGSGGAGEG